MSKKAGWAVPKNWPEDRGPSEDFALFYSFPLTILFKWQEVGWAGLRPDPSQGDLNSKKTKNQESPLFYHPWISPCLNGPTRNTGIRAKNTVRRTIKFPRKTTRETIVQMIIARIIEAQEN